MNVPVFVIFFQEIELLKEAEQMDDWKLQVAIFLDYDSKFLCGEINFRIVRFNTYGSYINFAIRIELVYCKILERQRNEKYPVLVYKGYEYVFCKLDIIKEKGEQTRANHHFVHTTVMVQVCIYNHRQNYMRHYRIFDTFRFQTLQQNYFRPAP